MEGLTVGRIVHYVNPVLVTGDDPEIMAQTQKYEHVAAIVTRVQNQGDGAVCLSAFYPGRAVPVAIVLCGYDATGERAGTWHWIERS